MGGLVIEGLITAAGMKLLIAALLSCISQSSHAIIWWAIDNADIYWVIDNSGLNIWIKFITKTTATHAANNTKTAIITHCSCADIAIAPTHGNNNTKITIIVGYSCLDATITATHGTNNALIVIVALQIHWCYNCCLSHCVDDATAATHSTNNALIDIVVQCNCINTTTAATHYINSILIAIVGWLLIVRKGRSLLGSHG
eukprot:5330082-Ditylum_brightwellii.AAC.1